MRDPSKPFEEAVKLLPLVPNVPLMQEVADRLNGEPRVSMTMGEYQEQALRTDSDHPIEYYALGLAGEAGEASGALKKYVFHDHGIPGLKVMEELGDCLWYLTAMAAKLGFSLEFVARQNVEKLRRRYPDGFSKEASKNRDEK
jgi:NTP pyrophosphatase (non-canonical NTP hydrolase)